ncbi:MAG: alpha/beta fold hydrolase [Proteobacteria bacterium]|nr:alpha/beta fold hydrolase [Pseudomonadota bacterium]
MTRFHVCWSHGKESGPWGAKITALADVAREMGLEADSLDYRGMLDPEARAARLEAHCRSITAPIILAGSSLGGYVAATAAGRVAARGLFLLAPALHLPGIASRDDVPPAPFITIVHGWRDDVIPPEHSFDYARRFRAELHLIDGDHRLKENIEELKRYFSVFLQRVVESG